MFDHLVDLTEPVCQRIDKGYPGQDLRAYPGTIRGSEEWDSTYKIRVNVDVLLAGITRLITVMAADKLHKHKYIRSLKPLIA